MIGRMIGRSSVDGRQDLAALVAEAAALLDPKGDPELEAIKVAILLEDALEVTLTDEEIALDTLTDPAAVAAVVARHARRP
jgi:hypothetical protein